MQYNGEHFTPLELQVGYFERLPRRVISEVHINPQLKKGVFDPRLKPWLDEEFVIEKVGIIALGNDNGQLQRFQPPSMQRGAILAYGQFFDENGVAYGQIGTKGSGLTADAKRVRFLPGAPYTDPHGFFGEKDAQQEEELSNEFAYGGGRGGRVLGYLVLDTQEFLKWLPQKESSYNIAEMARRVDKNGDRLAILERLMGTERVQDMFANQNGIYSRDNILRRSAGIMRAELLAGGYGNFYDYSRLEAAPKVFEMLSEVSAVGGQSTPSVMEDYTHLWSYLMGWNIGVLTAISQEKYKMKLKMPPFSHQNYDFAAFCYDWELAFEKTERTEVRTLIDNRATMLSGESWMQGFLGKPFHADSDVEIDTSMMESGFMSSYQRAKQKVRLYS